LGSLLPSLLKNFFWQAVSSRLAVGWYELCCVQYGSLKGPVEGTSEREWGSQLRVLPVIIEQPATHLPGGSSLGHNSPDIPR
jgi:hypothetical protein